MAPVHHAIRQCLRVSPYPLEQPVEGVPGVGDVGDPLVDKGAEAHVVRCRAHQGDEDQDIGEPTGHQETAGGEIPKGGGFPELVGKGGVGELAEEGPGGDRAEREGDLSEEPAEHPERDAGTFVTAKTFLFQP